MGFTKEGFRLSRENFQEEINQSDLYARTLIDTIYQGGNTHIETIARTSNGGVKTAFWPFGGADGSFNALGRLWNAANPIAVLGSANASSLVLTTVPNTPAASAADPASVTASKSILAPGFNAEMIMSSRAREVPIRFVCLPTDTAGVGTSFTAT